MNWPCWPSCYTRTSWSPNHCHHLDQLTDLGVVPTCISSAVLRVTPAVSPCKIKSGSQNQQTVVTYCYILYTVCAKYLPKNPVCFAFKSDILEALIRRSQIRHLYLFWWRLKLILSTRFRTFRHAESSGDKCSWSAISLQLDSSLIANLLATSKTNCFSQFVCVMVVYSQSRHLSWSQINFCAHPHEVILFWF